MSSPTDLQTLREGIKLGRMLGSRPEWGEFLGNEVFPGSAVQTDDEIDEYIKNTLHTANALTGTCKMGIGNDAVVAPDLKVLVFKTFVFAIPQLFLSFQEVRQLLQL